MRDQVIQKVLDKKVVAIVRGVYGEDCLRLAEAFYAGGIEIMEVTFDQSQPDRLDQTADSVALVAQKMAGRMVMGAGTVTSPEMVDLAQKAGAAFIVSPNTNEAVIRRTREAGLVSMPGALTPTEVLAAHEYGADFVKVFPVSELGPSYIKSLRGPLNHIRLLAVGGVNEKNVGEFLKAGAVGVGVGGNLVNKQLIAEGCFDQITVLAKEFVANSRK